MIECFVDNKYTRTYFKIIYRAITEGRSSDNDIYFERHHILPKSIFKEFGILKTHPWNGCLLTAKEHYICHLLLTKMFASKKHTIQMKHAFNAMVTLSTNSKQCRVYSRNFKRINTEFDEDTRHKMSISKLGSNNSFFGKHHSIDTIQKISSQLKGRTPWNKGLQFKSEDNPMFGRTHSEETKVKMRSPRKDTSKMKKPKSPEHVRKIQESRKRNREIKNQINYPLSDEVCWL